MRRKRAAIATRILRVSHFLRIIHSGGASAGTRLSRVPRAAFRKPPPASAERNRGKGKGVKCENASQSRRLAIEVTLQPGPPARRRPS